MSDDLVKRLVVQLRYLGDHAAFEPHMFHEAADRIEAQAAEIARLRDALATARWEGMEGFSDLVASAYVEATKAMQKYPQPNYVISKIAEEAGEVVKASIHCAEKRETAQNVVAEIKQLIAMLIRLWLEGDQVHRLPPIAAAIRAAAKEGKP